MQLAPLSDKTRVALAVAVSNNRKYFATVEEVEDSTSQVVNVYSTAADTKKVKCLNLDAELGAIEGVPTRVVAIGFRCGGGLQHVPGSEACSRHLPSYAVAVYGTGWAEAHLTYLPN